MSLHIDGAAREELRRNLMRPLDVERPRVEERSDLGRWSRLALVGGPMGGDVALVPGGKPPQPDPKRQMKADLPDWLKDAERD